MKTNKLYTILLTVALIAGMTTFYACEKNESNDFQKSTKSKGTNIEYMDIPSIDFSLIKKEKDMLKFDSWEHYAKVIDALLDFTYKYIDTRVNEILKKYEKIDEDALNEILQEQGFYQFMPLYSFCTKLQFDNSAFEKLRNEEIEWMKDPKASHNNPFDEMMLGYIQSALHNTNGDVMIGDEKFNPKDDLKNEAKSCLENASEDNGQNWPTYNYDGKKREIRAFIKSYKTYSFAKTSVYYFNKQNNRIVWLCRVGAGVSGSRSLVCNSLESGSIKFNGSNSVFASIAENYTWYTAAPKTFLSYPILYTVFSNHTAPGAPVTKLNL